NFPARRSAATENFPARRWLCPSDKTIAAYVDNALGKRRKTRLEAHLAKCERCRRTTADVVKLQREAKLPIPPLAIATNQVQVVPVVSTRLRWFWVPAGAMALLVLAAISIHLLRESEHLVVLAPPTPSAPVIAKVEPVNPQGTPVPEILRKPQVPEM